MDLQDLVTGNLAQEADNRAPSLLEDLESNASERELLLFAKGALGAIENRDGDWPEKVARFAARIPTAQNYSPAVQLLLMTIDAQSNPSALADLKESLQEHILLAEERLYTSSGEEALRWLKEIYPDNWTDLAAEAAGVRPATIRGWMDGKRPAQTKARKLFSLVLTLRMLQSHDKSWEESLLWLRAPLREWPGTPLEHIARTRWAGVPFEVRHEISA